jgi:DNA-directed RNA polymerase subunit RPC12/RpoP
MTDQPTFTIGGKSITIKCPRCGSKHVNIGAFSMKGGKMTATNIRCMDCGHLDKGGEV